MENLNLKKIWEIMNYLSNKQNELVEQNIYASLLGNSSNYCEMSFESFLKYYSFKIERDELVVFNQDEVPYESYYNDDFSHIPLFLVCFGEKEMEIYIQQKIESELKKQQEEENSRKEYLKQQIEILKNQLNEL